MLWATQGFNAETPTLRKVFYNAVTRTTSVLLLVSPMLSLTQGQAHATTYWEDLPKNLYYEVGRYLTSKDFKQLRNVSHAWRAGFCDHAHELVVEQCRELALLQDFKRIESLKLKVWSVPSARELQHIAALSNLRHVQLVVHKEGCVEDSLVVMLARCGTLRSFAMLPSDLPKISGQALEELVTLNALQSLDLRCCFNLTDADVATLSRCATLRSLNLSYCQQLTDQGVVTLSMLTNLSDLSLRYCRRVGDGGLRALATLTGVTALDLTVCNVSAGVVSAWAGRLRSLRSLTLSDGSYERVSDATLAAVADLTSLTRLHLAGCRQATPDGFAAIAEKLTLLTQLDLHHMQMVSWSWWHFAKQPRCVLRELHLTSCGPVVDDSGLAAVARLKQLHTLKLTRMWLSDAALQQLCASRSLQHVVLYMCTMLGQRADGCGGAHFGEEPQLALAGSEPLQPQPSAEQGCRVGG
ncbi:hypothetical protein WJX72_003343 [[Myrmecia] bisecta]|uniref:F-box domain-containing protein n=1 Tax=[Myrmecia] bisecta TaxID=41462 RepID=A0AAW1P6M1_9CHLO